MPQFLMQNSHQQDFYIQLTQQKMVEKSKPSNNLIKLKTFCIVMQKISLNQNYMRLSHYLLAYNQFSDCIIRNTEVEI